MKVLTRYPVYINKKEVSKADFYMYADDTLPTDAFSYADDSKTQAITAGIGAAANLGAALASRPKAPLSDVENRCGKKPKVGKKNKARWQECADKYNQQQAESGRMMNPALVTPAPPVVTNPPPTKSDNKMIYIGIGVVAIAVVGYFVYKSRTKTSVTPA